MLNVRRLKKSFLALIVSAICLIPATGYSQNVMRIAAVVNDDVISAHDLAQRVQLTIATARMPNTPEVRNRLAGTILRTMIDERLKTQEIERLNITISEDRIQQGMAGFANTINIKPEMLDRALEQIGVDKEVLLDQARAEIGWNLAISKQSGNRLRVSKKEIDAAIQQKEENKGKPEYLYSEIFLPIETANQEANTTQLAQRLIQHINNGASFAALARDFSKSPSAVKGGDLGWIQSGSISKKLESIISRLETNSYSQPIRTASGLHIIHLRDKRISGQEDNADILSVMQFSIPFNPTEAVDILQTRIGIANNLANQPQTCEAFKNHGDQIPGATYGRADGVSLTNMPTQIRTAVKPLSVGQTATVKTKKSILVLMVCNREKAPEVPEITKRNQIKQSILLEKVAREDRRLMQTLRRAAFVDIRL